MTDQPEWTVVAVKKSPPISFVDIVLPFLMNIEGKIVVPSPRDVRGVRDIPYYEYDNLVEDADILSIGQYKIPGDISTRALVLPQGMDVNIPVGVKISVIDTGVGTVILGPEDTIKCLCQSVAMWSMRR